MGCEQKGGGGRWRVRKEIKKGKRVNPYFLIFAGAF